MTWGVDCGAAARGKAGGGAAGANRAGVQRAGDGPRRRKAGKVLSFRGVGSHQCSGLSESSKRGPSGILLRWDPSSDKPWRFRAERSADRGIPVLRQAFGACKENPRHFKGLRQQRCLACLRTNSIAAGAATAEGASLLFPSRKQRSERHEVINPKYRLACRPGNPGDCRHFDSLQRRPGVHRHQRANPSARGHWGDAHAGFPNCYYLTRVTPAYG